jgi:hypothetical protein
MGLVEQKEERTANRRLAKRRAQWLNGALYAISNSVLADRFSTSKSASSSSAKTL